MEDIYKLDIVPINKIAEDLTQSYREQLSADGKNASGTLSNTSSYLVNYDGKILKISLLLEDYWKYVENDTKPHFPPIDKIRDWIRVKPVLPMARNGKLPTENQLAYLIARKISKVGTTGSHSLKSTIDKSNIYNKVINEIKNQIIEKLNSK